MIFFAAFCAFATVLELGDGFASAQGIACSPPKCDPPCTMNYSTQPCPSCECDDNPPPMIMCSPPKCDFPCKMNYSTQPCPSCECNNEQSRVRCSPPRCDAPCTMNYKTKPCPSCQCPMVQCSLPECNSPCEMNFNSSPCPSCRCPGQMPVQCPAPKCMPGTSLFYVPSRACPVCKRSA
ncbi:small proline-rich protein 2H-like [Argiope bruennichi]|uniref:Uncharacterized protein n=1 Tax=Argiope bruennichi TaxID=94029 RepID=A0A8T0EK42_ARGBR|nr:small proline-rich protein 2H-like [Argiope bruennichi]KAF8774322.1 hypothetical protein HNY73_016886 [Argiope bruennichi]